MKTFKGKATDIFLKIRFMIIVNKSEKTRHAFEKFAEEHGIEFQNGENEFSYFDLQTAFEAGWAYGTINQLFKDNKDEND